MEIYFIRHGETDFNVKQIIQGHSNSKLNENGITQAVQISELLINVKFDAVYSSDLSRAIETAKIISNSKIKIITSNKLRERDFGTAEGKTFTEHAKEIESILKIFRENEEKAWKLRVKPDIESNQEILDRVLRFIKKLSINHPTDSNILIATHGGVLKVLLVHLGYAKINEYGNIHVNNVGYIIVENNNSEISLKNTFGVTKLNKR